MSPSGTAHQVVTTQRFRQMDNFYKLFVSDSGFLTDIFRLSFLNGTCL